MLNALVDFIIGFLIGRSAVNSGRAARNSALAAERATWTEEMKRDYQAAAELPRWGAAVRLHRLRRHCRAVGLGHAVRLNAIFRINAKPPRRHGLTVAGRLHVAVRHPLRLAGEAVDASDQRAVRNDLR
jgi:hypothetical protein